MDGKEHGRNLLGLSGPPKKVAGEWGVEVPGASMHNSPAGFRSQVIKP